MRTIEPKIELIVAAENLLVGMELYAVFPDNQAVVAARGKFSATDEHRVRG